MNIEAPDLTSYNLMNAQEKLMFEKVAGLYSTEMLVVNKILLTYIISV